MELITKNIINEFKLKGILPKHIDSTQVGNRYWFVCHDGEDLGVMSERSTTGFSFDSNIALLKALSEKVENMSFNQGRQKGLTSCLTERSDGFAAYPIKTANAEAKVREAALSEAVERYVWATWWDHEDIQFNMKNIKSFMFNSVANSYLAQIEKECEISEIFVIEPCVENLESQKVLILFARLKDGGFISGGACGEDEFETILRSLDELFRHGLAIKKIKNTNQEHHSFYEKRLAYFGLGKGDRLINKRLSQKGNRSITLPKLIIDEPVESVLKNHYLVYRCLFVNQPPFIGGELERMCL